MAANRRLPASREIVGAAVAEVAQAIAPAPEPVQDALFALPAIPAANGRLDGAALTAEGERQRKAGRPPGAQNKSTIELRKWLLANGIVPQQWQMRWLLLEPEEMARRLQITLSEAWDRQAALARELAPYLMSRMAPSDDKGNAVPMLAFNINGTGAPGERAPWEIEAQLMEAAGTGLTIDGGAAEGDAEHE